MIVGIPKEIKDQERRVALLPEAVARLTRAGIRLWVQEGAGVGVGCSDRLYREAGARLVKSARELYKGADMVVKVKEPLPEEYRFFRPGLRLFCFLHLAASPALAVALCRSDVTALAFETLIEKGTAPLLKPMSEIAGRLSLTIGAHYLRSDQGGKGILLSPTPYSPGARVAVIGGGTVGKAAAGLAAGLGAQVTLFDLQPEKLRDWAKNFPTLQLRPSRPALIASALRHADLAIGAVYIPGARAPRVIRTEMIRGMEPSSVWVDVAIDQGGSSETSRPTSLSHPVYRRYGVIHYAVPNMPALASRTASYALSRLLESYVKKLANLPESSLVKHPVFGTALNVSGGRVVHPSVRSALR
ncbi:MAG TPA: alanine dehydrogenase [Deltaproteobacteria bacterium]|nr:alanine dehydrogenase [Deltaproteobacteria bacterium]